MISGHVCTAAVIEERSNDDRSGDNLTKTGIWINKTLKFVAKRAICIDNTTESSIRRHGTNWDGIVLRSDAVATKQATIAWQKSAKEF